MRRAAADTNKVVEDDNDQVKLTLAVETKDDMLYDISRDANERA